VERHTDLVVAPDDADLAALDVSGMSGRRSRRYAMRLSALAISNRCARRTQSAVPAREMRIHRIALRNFRGVDSVDVALATSGVTIVEGRNEIGKTSIADALMLLFDAKDSSRASRSRTFSRSGATSGPSWSRVDRGALSDHVPQAVDQDKKTELDITEPQREQLTGESAHNRMIEILDRETDPDLFRALRYQQGSRFHRPKSRKPKPCRCARRRGRRDGRDRGAGQDALFGRVEQDRLRYFTPGGAVLARGRRSSATRRIAR